MSQKKKMGRRESHQVDLGGRGGETAKHGRKGRGNYIHDLN